MNTKTKKVQLLYEDAVYLHLIHSGRNIRRENLRLQDDEDSTE
jgi:hypothetical protein